MNEVIFGSYTILEHLGAGGMSRVDLGRRVVEEARWVRLVAIKRIRGEMTQDPSLVRMFCDEARIGAELHHENIAQIYDFGRQGDELVLVMEYVPGVDLRVMLGKLRERKAKMPVRIALTIVLGVLAALGHAHARRDPLGAPLGIVHRDVNPRNVMVSLRGEVKLIDFGVALAADRMEQTEVGKVKGKFTYMAPEQLEGRTDIDGRADLFAVGLLLTEMVNGRSPFVGMTEIQAVHRIVAGRIPALDGVDASILDALRPVGGPASSEEVAAFVRASDPDGVRRVESRIRAWRAGLPTPEETASEAFTQVRTDFGPTRTRAFPLPSAGAPWWVVPVLGGLTLISTAGSAVGAWVWWHAERSPFVAPAALPVVTFAPPSPKEIDPDTPGTLNVYTEPDGVAVYLDGTYIGISPLIDVPCAAGMHVVQARQGSRRAQETVTVPPGAWSSVQLTFR